MVRINRILCPIDFSEFSSHALSRAVAIAKSHGATVTVLHVVPLRAPLIVSGLELSDSPRGMTSADRERLVLLLAAFIAPHRTSGVPIEIDVVEAPTVHGEVLSEADRLKADLVVMGTHGRSGFQRLFLGSVAEKVLRTSPQPVLTVGALAATDPTGAFSRVLCAIDFSACSIAALDYAVAFADGAGAQVTAVNVVEWLPVGYDPLIGPAIDFAGYRLAAETVARQRLHDVVAKAAPTRHDIQEIVSAGKPHHEILRIAAEDKSDLLVLGIHGRRAVDRLLFGSTAEPVIRRSTCPVLSVRSGALANAAAASRDSSNEMPTTMVGLGAKACVGF